jgi:hypothetical protein
VGLKSGKDGISVVEFNATISVPRAVIESCRDQGREILLQKDQEGSRMCPRVTN